MAITKITPISDQERKGLGVSALANRPNLKSQYGQGQLNPEQLKEWFDKLSNKVADKVNDLIDALGSEEAAKYIGIGDDTSLADLISTFSNGEFAKSLSAELPTGEKTSLQEIITQLLLDISASVTAVTINGGRLYVTFQGGDVIDTDIVIGSHNISDKAITEEKLDDSLKERINSVEDGSISREKLDSTVAEQLDKRINNVRYDSEDGTFHIVLADGTDLSVDFPLELIVSGGSYDASSKDLILTLANGTNIAIPLDHISENLLGIIDGKQDKLTFDSEPMILSQNPVTSDGIYNYIHYVARLESMPKVIVDTSSAPVVKDEISGAVEPIDDAHPELEYRCVGNLTTPPSIYISPFAATSIFILTVIYRSPGTAAPTIVNYGSYAVKYLGEDVSNGVFTPKANKIYRLSFLFDGFYINCYVSGVS